MDASHVEREEDMKEWIRNVQHWMEQNAHANEKTFVDEPESADMDPGSVLDTILCVHRIVRRLWLIASLQRLHSR